MRAVGEVNESYQVMLRLLLAKSGVLRAVGFTGYGSGAAVGYLNSMGVPHRSTPYTCKIQPNTTPTRRRSGGRALSVSMRDSNHSRIISAIVSFMFLTLVPDSAASASSRFDVCSCLSAIIPLSALTASILSSTVWSIASFQIFTSRIWPRRCARSNAWSSSLVSASPRSAYAGFHHMSVRMTLLQHVRLSPVLPALKEMRITLTSGLVRMSSSTTARSSADSVPSSPGQRSDAVHLHRT